jgi:hypothetical protein
MARLLYTVGRRAVAGETGQSYLSKGTTSMNASTMQTQTVLVDELRIRYADSGAADGAVILFTSPWPESLFAFRRVWPALARTARLVAVDLPGFGHSQGPPAVLTPGTMADFLVPARLEPLPAGCST